MSIENRAEQIQDKPRFFYETIVNDNGDVIGKAAVFTDPLMLDRTEWRKLIESHISPDPATISMISQDQEVTIIDQEKIQDLRSLTPSERRYKLSILAYLARHSAAVAVTRHTDSTIAS